MPTRRFIGNVRIPQEIINIRIEKEKARDNNDLESYFDCYDLEKKLLDRWTLRNKKIKSL